MWLFFASLTAFFEACKDATGKHSLKRLDEYSVLFGFMAVGVVLLLPVLWLTGGIPPLLPNFWLALSIGGSLNILAFTLYVRALKIADLSLTVPLVTLTPLFLLGTSPLIVQEWPTWADAVGVLLLVVGSYVLNLPTPVPASAQAEASSPSTLFTAGTLFAAGSQRPVASSRRSLFLAPLAAMVRNPGSRLMLCVAFIWSITSNFDKIGVVNSSPLFWAIALFSVIALGMVPFVFLPFVVSKNHRKFKGNPIEPLRANWRILGITGGFNAIAITFQMLALTLAPVAQVIAVKRMSALLSVLFGHFFFGEKGLKSRLVGAAVMVSGVVIMSLQ
ncbi:MAG: DMT family transporter [Cyanobacteria bacterium P01_A01_bin.116]